MIAYHDVLSGRVWRLRESRGAILKLYETCVMEHQLTYKHPLGLQNLSQLE